MPPKSLYELQKIYGSVRGLEIWEENMAWHMRQAKKAKKAKGGKSW